MDCRCLLPLPQDTFKWHPWCLYTSWQFTLIRASIATLINANPWLECKRVGDMNLAAAAIYPACHRLTARTVAAPRFSGRIGQKHAFHVGLRPVKACMAVHEGRNVRHVMTARHAQLELYTSLIQLVPNLARRRPCVHTPGNHQRLTTPR
jgi:hypothetical protein